MILDNSNNQQFRKMIKIFTALVLICFFLVSMPKLAQADANPALEFSEELVLQVIRNHPEAIFQSIQDYQRQQQNEQQQLRNTTLHKLKNNPEKFIAESTKKGEFGQDVLIEFSDFQCPYCAKVRKTLNRFMTKHKDNVKLVYKHYPLVQIHPESMAAARASWAADQQGKFWEYHNALFEQQNRLNETVYIEIAGKIGLNLEQFNQDRNSSDADSAIQQDIELAENLGITATPFFVMNGETFSGAVQLSEMENMFIRSQETAIEKVGES